MEQSDQSQRELVLPTLTQIVTQQSHLPSEQESNRQAVLAFIEYLNGFQHEAIEHRFGLIPFDTGMYFIDEPMFFSSLAQLTFLIYTILRKKKIVDLGKKPMQIHQITAFLQGISLYLGFYNLYLYLPGVFYESPNRFFEPLSEAQWQELTENTMSGMLAKKYYNMDYSGCLTERSSMSFEVSTSFEARYQVVHYQAHNSYVRESEEAKRAAEAIVQGELVRLRLFLEALQGTLRLLDCCSKQPTCTEGNPPAHLNEYRNVGYGLDGKRIQKDIAEIIRLLKSLLEEDGDRQNGIPQEQGMSIVESEITLPATVALQVRKEEHTDNRHTYHLTLTDSRHLSEPVPFLLRVAESGEAELFEDASNG